MVDDIDTLKEIWRQVLSEDVKAWVIFKNGTCVVCRESDKDPSEYATKLMKNMGIVIPGSSHGDFVVHPLDKILGWIVEYHHEDIFSYVSPSEFEGEDVGDMMVGLHGRHRRGEDAQSLDIIHVEIRDPEMNSD
ncbi:MAG: hypothetical protein E4H14_12270 [Candidatus Thorarchaeota archaeon]|nr:MAG: hypothetical protein E4H14_12270 [Candidatus Thorarchaeota archaeon]